MGTALLLRGTLELALLVAAAIDLSDGGSRPKTEIVGNCIANDDRDFGVHLFCPQTS